VGEASCLSDFSDFSDFSVGSGGSGGSSGSGSSGSTSTSGSGGDVGCSVRTAAQVAPASGGGEVVSALRDELGLHRSAGAWLFLQMELCPFPTLAHWLSHGGGQRRKQWAAADGAAADGAAVPDATRWLWVRGLASGLEAVHAAGWVHNDVKPANIFACPATGAVKLADFGCCARTGSLAAAGGTPAYAPPERLCGDPRPADPSSDVFSLGVVVAEVFGQFATSMERAEAVMRLMAPQPRRPRSSPPPRGWRGRCCAGTTRSGRARRRYDERRRRRTQLWRASDRFVAARRVSTKLWRLF